MRPGSIVMSGNEKRRSTHTETRRPGPDFSGMNVLIPRRPSGERGDNFIGSFYTSYSPFTASCLLRAIMQSQELDFLQMTVLSDRQVPLIVWAAQPAKNVGSGLTVWPDASRVLALDRSHGLPALSHLWQHVKLSDPLSWGPSAIEPSS